MAHRQQRAKIKAHEAGIAGHNDSVRLAVRVNQARCGVSCESVCRLPLLRSQSAAGFELFDQWAHDGTDVVIENRREVGVPIARQKRLES